MKNKKMVEKMEKLVILIAEAKELKEIPIKDIMNMDEKIKTTNISQNYISTYISSLIKKIYKMKKDMEKKDKTTKILENDIKNLKKDRESLKVKCNTYERELEEIRKSISYRFGKKMSRNVVGKSVKKILAGGVSS